MPAQEIEEDIDVIWFFLIFSVAGMLQTYPTIMLLRYSGLGSAIYFQCGFMYYIFAHLIVNDQKYRRYVWSDNHVIYFVNSEKEAVRHCVNNFGWAIFLATITTIATVGGTVYSVIDIPNLCASSNSPQSFVVVVLISLSLMATIYTSTGLMCAYTVVLDKVPLKTRRVFKNSTV